MKWTVNIDTNTNDYYFENLNGKYLCKRIISFPSVEYRLVSRSTLSTADCYWSGESGTFIYGDKGYTRLTITDTVLGQTIEGCIDTTPANYDQCDDTQRIGLTTNCDGYTGGVYFEKVNV